jgi:prepilin-type N-terminal cleavage/methylation domain-containing protein
MLFRSSRRGAFARFDQGLSLLEVMITMVLLVLVVTSFATIYPSGFRLHRKSRMATQAAQASRAVLNEMKNLPLTREDGGLSLAYLATNGFSVGDPTLDGFPKTELPAGFRIATDNGIKVTLYDLASGTDPSVYASMSVTLIYDDPYRGRDEPIRMTLVAGKSWNR